MMLTMTNFEKNNRGEFKIVDGWFCLVIEWAQNANGILFTKVTTNDNRRGSAELRSVGAILRKKYPDQSLRAVLSSDFFDGQEDIIGVLELYEDAGFHMIKESINSNQWEVEAL